MSDQTWRVRRRPSASAPGFSKVSQMTVTLMARPYVVRIVKAALPPWRPMSAPAGGRKEGDARAGRRCTPALAADAALVPCLAEQALREIQPFVGFRQFLLQAIDALLQRLQPRRDIDRQRGRSSGLQL